LRSAIARLQDKFIDNVSNEYPSHHNLVDTRKTKEDIKMLNLGKNKTMEATKFFKIYDKVK
jgi:hypothetical protein